jgi:glutathione S-transferase
MAESILTLSSKNYGAWSLRGWLLVKFSGLPFVEKVLPPDDVDMRAEILLLSSSILVPSLLHNGIKIWDTLAIGEYLHEIRPKAGLLPADLAERAHCRAICGEMHSGFGSMRASMPFNVKAMFPKFKVWSRAESDVKRILDIWTDCLTRYGGPFLFGKTPGMADAMYAPVVSRFRTYDIPLETDCVAYCTHIWTIPAMQEWIAAAQLEPDDFDELDAEF